MKKILLMCILAGLITVSNAEINNTDAGLDAFEIKDYKTALTKWTIAAENGQRFAQQNLAMLYRYGKGVSVDNIKAFTWYEKSAKQDVAIAQYNLAVMYRDSIGVPQNYSQAFLWFEKAANQDHPAAQNNLGVMYANGNSVEKDMVKAKYWIKKAYEDGKNAISKMAEENWNGYQLWKY